MPVGRLPRSEQFPRYSKRVVDSVMEVGGERVVGLFDKVYALDPDFAEVYVEYVRGAMYSREVLSQQVREICACAALTLLNRPSLLKAHLLNGAYVGASLDQLREAIVQMVLYGGFPATLTALDVFAETFPEASVKDRPALPATIEGLGTDNYYEPAIAAAAAIYGEQHVRGVVDQISRWDQAWGQVYQHFVYAGVKDRDVVDVKVRQLLAITGCIVTEQLEDFEVEVQAALRAGLSRAEIQEVILQMSVYLGMPRALKAGRIFERIADAWEHKVTSLP